MGRKLDVIIADGDIATIGLKADSAASTDTGAASLVALVKRLLSKWTTGVNILNGGNAISVSNPLLVRSRNDNLQTMLVREGMPIFGSSSSNSGVKAAGASLTSHFINATHAWFVDTLTLSSNEDIMVLVTTSAPSIAAAGITGMNYRVMLKAGVPLPISINRFIYELNTISILTQTVTTSGFSFTSSLGGVRVCNDFAFDADKTMLVIGDSISNGTGPSYGVDSYTFIVRDWLYSQGKSTRCILKGSGSYTSANITALRKTGQLMPTAPDLVLYNIGINDASLAAFQAEFPSILAHKQKYWPNAKMICLGMTPKQGANEAAVSVPIRSYMATTIAALNDPKIYYCSLANAFSPVGDTYYMTTDNTTNTTRIHPNDAGHLLMAGVITQFIDGNNIEI